MIEIQFPEPAFKVKHQKGVPYIFDVIRRTWLLLQDEEWVRQNFVQYLLQVMQYPQSLVALEKEIYLGELKKRFDILVYDQNHKPWMLIECKSEKINLKDDVLHQALRYNIVMPAKYLVITNGKQTYGWEKKNGTLEMIHALPEF
ncbi:MAG: restriction endonuclease subunit R [Sphingobacteriales bacterium 41-5]|nr:MAG: restriction endonuclease subunit R [Sphingobacteriales bacterium 41-5]